jgi:phospholipid transport system substrate-binding protein
MELGIRFMKRVLIGTMLIIFIGIKPIALFALEKQPSATVEHLNTTLLSVMKEAQELGFEGRYQRLFPVISEAFNFPFVARYILGSYWDKLSEEQRQQFIEAFRALSVTDYARHFDGYSGERFSIEEEVPFRGDMRVRSKLVDPAGSSVIFDYFLRETDGQWRIVNVIVDGVSDVAVKRAEYRQLIKSKGFDGLLNKLQEQIALYQRQAGA